MNRDELISTLNLAAMALGPEESVFGGFWFTDRSVLAHNSVISVMVQRPEGAAPGAVPGRLLLKFLKSCTGSQLEFVETSINRGTAWRVKCGPTKLDFVHQEDIEFSAKVPDQKRTTVLQLNDDFFRGLALCSSIVLDSGLAVWTGGVTLKIGKKVCLASTSPNRNQIYYYDVGEQGYTVKRSKRRKKDSIKILPVSFCKVALAFYKQFSGEKIKLHILDNFVLLEFGGIAHLTSKTIIPDIEIDITQKVRDLLKDLGNFIPISDKLREVIDRSASIAGTDADMCLLTVKKNGRTEIVTHTDGGVVEDTLQLDGGHPAVEIKTNPKLLARGMSECTEIKIGERLTGFRGDQFVKLVANRGS